MAMEQKSLTAQERQEFGKGASRRLRRDGQTPAVLYGHGAAPAHLTVDAHDLFLIVKDNPNALLSVTVEGSESGNLLALVKDIQRNPVTRRIIHVDLQRVTRDEKVEVEVPVEVVGESAPGTIHTIEFLNVQVSAPAIDIPDSVIANVEGMEDGSQITAADLQHADDVEVLLDPEEVVVSVMRPEVDLALEEADAAVAEAQAEEAREESEEHGATNGE
ncbi:large subunit ribosomal protein L25 [Actinobaculum suis]|uniref:Large ribosomal subunit protein bL25 n=1 Tax=Actinobaculum suis TaxID=1657 RepID=A0A0K9EVK1_9ACTO|nr:50S ribosomal protein L25/general stress protein Ctc [Actinobaculum suis]KMY23882.1 50S ribosomal protein L25 [Actinobaculum suis]MDY5153605.1 50S ribosomal protein L25/general stress protein Ctc [Actinobaculum suis]OCA93106.1 50S ribosomal protein L25/general stress protein Ctc [Actinobaculum suis]OCA93252.1 50S ribosomal protein L25/general stress protein Ctc [Actinobaculum suis]SDE23941.1 large subunit ribosomal protein L25 [Actinobaculum suis]